MSPLLMMGAWLGLVTHVAAADVVHAPVITFRGVPYQVRTINPRKDDLRLFLNDSQARPLRTFTALEAEVRSERNQLLFAANAGMFQPDHTPVGLLVCNCQQISPLDLEDGTGNFFLKPNGVFLINAKHEAMVIGSSAYPTLLTPVIWATQSGPLLVNEGDIHPDFIEGSSNLNIRSGVGVTKDGAVIFALSTKPVNFYDFAYFFLHRLKCPNALYLDGTISAFHTEGQPEKAGTHDFGPMFGLVVKQAGT